jgi:hypothetical protein
MPCVAQWYRQMSSYNISLESAIDRLQNAHKKSTIGNIRLSGFLTECRLILPEFYFSNK